MVIETAYIYALNYTLYGEDVTRNWVTATQNSAALEKAYRDGYYDGLRAQASGSGFLSKSEDKYFKDRLPKLPYSSCQTLKDVREILDILDKHGGKEREE
jgi:hypothetical protein